MADVNKTLVRSLSSQSLNTTKTFNEPHVQAPKLASNHNLPSTSHSDHNDVDTTPKLTADELSMHNLMGKEIEMRISSIQNVEIQNDLTDICQMYKSSFQRLNKFCEEVQKIQTSKSTVLGDDISLASLDQNLLDLMEKLCQVHNYQLQSYRCLIDIILELTNYIYCHLVKFIVFFQALHQIHFIAENQNIYTTGIKENDSLLSDDLTDILEHFYRVTK